MRSKTLFGLISAGAVMLASAGTAQAASYCQPGTSNADGMSLSDVTFSGNLPTPSADDCYGILQGTDVPTGPGSGSADKASVINGLGLTWGTDWTYLVKDDAAGGTTAGTFGGINYTLNSGAAATSGQWTLTAGPASLLPVYVDFVVVLKSSTAYALWFFDEVKIDGSDGGTWTSVFKNQNGKLQDLSHLSLYVREGDTVDPPIVIPEPGSLALVGLALAAAGLGARRRRQG